MTEVLVPVVHGEDDRYNFSLKLLIALKERKTSLLLNISIKGVANAVYNY